MALPSALVLVLYIHNLLGVVGEPRGTATEGACVCDGSEPMCCTTRLK